MSLAESLINSLVEPQTDEDDKTLVIDHYTRSIIIPQGITSLGVENDDDVLRLNFKMPRYLGTVDLYNFNIRINYINAQGKDDVYDVTDKAVIGDNIIFSWLVGPTATAYRGNTRFNVAMVITNSDSTVQQAYNTTVASLPVRQGLECSKRAISKYSDILAQWESRLFGIADTEEASIIAVSEAQQTAIVNKGTEVLATIPADYTSAVKMAEEGVRTKADAIICSAEGETITVHDSSDDHLRGLKIFGKTTQVTTTGKNLWNGEYVNLAIGATADTNYELVAMANSYYRSIVIPVTPGKTYSFSRGAAIWSKLYIAFTKEYPASGTLVVFEDGKSGKLTLGSYSKETALEVPNITVPADCNYILVYLTNDSDVYDVTQTWYQVEEGETVTEYEPYTGGVASPSPEWPQELVSIENPIVSVYGSNLLTDYTGYKKTVSGITCEFEGEGVYHIYGTFSGTNPSIQFADIRLDMPVDPDAKYTLSCELVEGTPPDDYHPYVGLSSDTVSHRDWIAVNIDATNKVGDIVSHTLIPTNSLNNPTHINKFWIYAHNDTLETYTADFRIRVWLTMSDVPMHFEPYTRHQLAYTNTLPGIPVTTGGNYTDSNGQQWICDEIDFERGVYVQRTGTRVLTGDTSEHWGLYNPAEEGKVFHCYLVMKNYARRWPTTFCDRFRNVSIVWERQEYGLFSDYNTSDLLYFSAPNADVIDMSTWRTWLSNNPTTLVYLLATPIETPLTADEIAAFKALRSNYPNTTVMNDAGAQMSLRYNADTKTYLDRHIKAAVSEWLNEHYPNT